MREGENNKKDILKGEIGFWSYLTFESYFFNLRLKSWTLREGKVFSSFTSLTEFGVCVCVCVRERERECERERVREREREGSITTLCLMAPISQVFVARFGS